MAVTVTALPFTLTRIQGDYAVLVSMSSLTNKQLCVDVVNVAQGCTSNFSYNATRVSSTQYNYKVSGWVQLNSRVPANTTVNMVISINATDDLGNQVVPFRVEVNNVTFSNNFDAIYVSADITVESASEIIDIINYAEQRTAVVKLIGITKSGYVVDYPLYTTTTPAIPGSMLHLMAMFLYVGSNDPFVTFRLIDVNNNNTVITEISSSSTSFVSTIAFNYFADVDYPTISIVARLV